MIKVSLALLSLFVLASCSSNSNGGTTIGMKGSPYWNGSAPQADIDAYYAPLANYELCMIWAEKYFSSSTRRNIARELEKRGLNPMMCNNPAEDSARKSAAENAALKSRLSALENKNLMDSFQVVD
jgi:hypothetical protein